jgi:N-acetylmuramoyl-L-alanine amidase
MNVLLMLLVISPLYAIDVPGVRHNNVAYISLQTLKQVTGGRISKAPVKHKTTLAIRRHTFTFTRLSPVVTIGKEETYRLPYKTRYFNGTLHIPAACLSLLSRRTGLHFRLTDQPLALSKPPAETKISQISPSTKRVATPPSKTNAPQKKRDTEQQAARWTLTTVVIDPGHGGKDPGALGHGGGREKTIVRGVAKRLKTLLEKQLKVEVVLTRQRDTFIPLHKRAKIAREKGGKVFISLHCNATKNRNANGMEVYFLSEAKTKEAADVAKLENASLKYEKDDPQFALNGIDEAYRDIALSLLTAQFLKESQDLAADIHNAIAQHIPDINKRGVKQANFQVMRGTMAQMPSVLVELGFITNIQEEKRLKSSSHQKKLAEAVYRGIKIFKLRYEQQLSTNN